MVAVDTPARMPVRQFSAAIVGSSWPCTDPSSFQSASQAQHEKALSLLECADRTRADAQRVQADQSGDLVDGFCDESFRMAATFAGQADRWFTISRITAECAWLTDGLRHELDGIDGRAHQVIDQILRTATGPSAALAGQRVMAVVAAARGEATAKGAEYVTAISAKGAEIEVGA